MTCEKCWADAYALACHRGGSQVEWYRRLLEERRDHPCSPREQAGEYWDTVLRCDSRMKPQREGAE